MTNGRVFQEFLPEMIRKVSGEREGGSPVPRASGLRGQEVSV